MGGKAANESGLPNGPRQPLYRGNNDLSGPVDLLFEGKATGAHTDTCSCEVVAYAECAKHMARLKASC